MYNKFISLFLTILIFSSAFAAKNSGIIYGKVVEKENGNALPFATVSILNNEKKIIGGATSGEDGKFTVNNILFGVCNVKVSFIGFKDTTLNIRIAENATNIDLGTIALATDAVTLKSAVVTARIPVIEQKLDKIVMNVADAISTQGSNALDVLRKAPGISIDPDGNILLNGSAVQIWIDGRPSYLSGQELESLLSSTDGASIDKIEIIAHPSAKYDASGSGGIINIRTRKNFAKGINGSLRAAYSAAPYSKYYQSANGAFNINYRGEKTNTSLSFSPRYNENFVNFYSTSDMGSGRILKGVTEADLANNIQSYKISNDFFLNKKNTFGIIVSGLVRNAEMHTSDPVTGSKLYHNGTLVEKVNTGIDNNDNFGNVSANLNYTHIFKDNQEITVNADYGYYDIGNYSFQTNDFLDVADITLRPAEIFQSNSSQYINIKAIKADYEQVIWKTAKLEAGIKWAESRTQNDLVREDKINNVWVRNNQLSNKFNYVEDVSAAYISLSKQINPKWSAKAGIRAELTNAKGDWISADTITKKNYLDIFPTAFLGYTPKNNLRFGLSYAYRIKRPSFFQLNPFRMYIDASSSLEGNPNLDPEFSHQVSLSLGIGKNLSISLNGQFTENVIIQNPSFNSSTGEKMLMWENFGKQSFMGATVSLTELPINKWFVLSANCFVANVKNKDVGYSKSSLFTQGYMNAAFLLPKNYKIELSGRIQSGIPYGYFVIKPTGDLSMGIKKNLLDNKATLSLNVNDIFRTQNTKAILNSNALNNYEFQQNNSTRQIILNFSYRFGQGKAVKARKVGESEEAARVAPGN
ncbi:MAG: outer membrane beta-barrel protein [Bacteroidales bacterium]|jgi:outer membrane receptor protein involved in Fe transport